MGNEVTKKQALMSDVSANLQALLQHNTKAMPSGFNETRFLQNCLTVLKDTKDIEQCTPASVARTMLKGAFLDLDFFTKECYAIVYGKKLDDGTWIKALQFQTDYKGERKLCMKYSVKPIKEIYAKIVREDDDFIVGIDEGKQVISFNPKPFSNKKVIGCFAVVNYQDGSMQYETMSVEEIEKTRQNFSKAPNSKAWQLTPEEMYKKTILRRLCKTIDLQFENQEQKKAFDDGSDFDEKKANEVIDINIDDPYAEEKEEIKKIETNNDDLFNKNPNEVKCDENGKVIE